MSREGRQRGCLWVCEARVVDGKGANGGGCVWAVWERARAMGLLALTTAEEAVANERVPLDHRYVRGRQPGEATW